ncbi:hypothetical protein D5S18_26305 [Nocardia panacis]|uniref:DUF4386 domain-containing protein n=1 Tax=Nocardia panacis TaxID=2340916 RepID=A0A3A4KE36_9NOCA|nr:hypothetical protein D5S18_26305 [Nocardia panacis]
MLVVSASLCFCGYGAIRLVGKASGHYGPGIAWQAAHLAGLAALALFVPVVLGLGRGLPRGPVRTGVLSVPLMGSAAAIIQFGIDIVFAVLAPDATRMTTLYRDFSAIPGVSAVVYTVGPQLFYAGLVLLVVLLVRVGRLPWWSAVVLVVSVLLSIVSLDLLPITSLGILGALLPAGRLSDEHTGPRTRIPDAELDPVPLEQHPGHA